MEPSSPIVPLKQIEYGFGVYYNKIPIYPMDYNSGAIAEVRGQRMTAKDVTTVDALICDPMCFVSVCTRVVEFVAASLKNKEKVYIVVLENCYYNKSQALSC